jgi:hypothetical protein
VGSPVGPKSFIYPAGVYTRQVIRPIRGGGVDIAAPGIENGDKYRRGHAEIDTKMLEGR